MSTFTTELKGLSVGLSGGIAEPEVLAGLRWSELDVRALVSCLADGILSQGGGIVLAPHPTFLELIRTVAEALVTRGWNPNGKRVRLLASTQEEACTLRQAHDFYARVEVVEQARPVHESVIALVDVLVCIGAEKGQDLSTGVATPDESDSATLSRKPVYFAVTSGRQSPLPNGLNDSDNLRLASEDNPFIAATLILRGLRAYQGARMENKRKHLDMIQAVVTRLAGNSFLLKGWSVTLVSALFAFAAKDSKPAFAMLAFFPVIVFWLLDGYFLSQERTFRAIFDVVRTKSEADIDFSMSPAQLGASVPSWSGALFSKTVLFFHGMLIAAIVAVMLALPRSTS